MFHNFHLTFHLDTFHRQLPNPEVSPDLNCELFGASCETPIYLSSLAKGKLVDPQGEATFVPREVTLRWGFLCKFLPKFVWGEKHLFGKLFLMMFCWWGIYLIAFQVLKKFGWKRKTASFWHKILLSFLKFMRIKHFSLEPSHEFSHLPATGPPEMRAAERLKSRFLVPTISSVPLEEVWKATQFLGCKRRDVCICTFFW